MGCCSGVQIVPVSPLQVSVQSAWDRYPKFKHSYASCGLLNFPMPVLALIAEYARHPWLDVAVVLYSGQSSALLDLEEARLGDRRVAWLTELRRLPFLTNLALQLGFNRIHARGARRLASLHSTPNLTKLSLGLQNNSIGDAGVDSLSSLWTAPQLTDLSLDLRNNGIGDLGALSLSKLGQGRLVNLSLDLCSNLLGPAGVRHLSSLLNNKSLVKLKLDFSSNPIGDIGISYIASAKRGYRLTELNLQLVHCSVTAMGAATLLAGFSNSRGKLATLTINLQDNPLGSAGEQSLRELETKPGTFITR